MAPTGSSHASCADKLNQLLNLALGVSVIIRVQNPIHLSDDSEPQPDITVLRPQPDFYTDDHPTPGDVLLVVEVADTSMGYDREMKVPLYARNGIQEAWLVDLLGETVEVYRNPSREGYRQIQRLYSSDTVSPLAFPDVTMDVDGILAPKH